MKTTKDEVDAVVVNCPCFQVQVKLLLDTHNHSSNKFFLQKKDVRSHNTRSLILSHFFVAGLTASLLGRKVKLCAAVSGTTQ